MVEPATGYTAVQTSDAPAIASELFPLPLTPFEHFLLLDDTPARPMTSFIELQFSTPLERTALQRALTDAVHRNPTLASTIQSANGVHAWKYDPLHKPEILDASEYPVHNQEKLRHINLLLEVGIRFWYFPRQDGSTLLIQVHHACSDGVGVRRLVLDFFSAYAQITGDGQAIRPMRHDLNQLKDRWDFKHVAPKLKSKLSWWQKLCNAKYFFFDTPDSLACSGLSDAGHTTAFLADQPLCHCSVSRDLSQKILERCKCTQLAVSELAMALLFKTCWQWNNEFAKHRLRRRLRILLPFDLRGRSDLRMPAANRMSFAFLGRTYEQCSRWDELLRSVVAETEFIRKHQVGLDFLGGLEAVHRHPKLGQWLVGKCRNMATAVLTYTGDLARGAERNFPDENDQRVIGDARLINAAGAPPVRENTNISIGLCVNWGQLMFSANWDRHAMTRADCNLFLSRYAEAWHQWCDNTDPKNRDR